jgi:hypothetical protein
VKHVTVNADQAAVADQIVSSEAKEAALLTSGTEKPMEILSHKEAVLSRHLVTGGNHLFQDGGRGQSGNPVGRPTGSERWRARGKGSEGLPDPWCSRRRT